MPRVHYVKKARKDNPAVEKGESYYWWKFRYAGKRYSKTRPRPSQLTQSDKLSRLFEAQESIDDAIDAIGDFAFDHSYVENLVDTLAIAATDVRDVGEEYMESADNIRMYIEESPVADKCEEKYYNCESMADEIEETRMTIEDLEFPEEYPGDGNEYDDAVRDAVNVIDWNI